MKKLNIVLIGADKNNIGFGSRAHIPAIKALKQYYNFYGICTTKEESSYELHKIHNTSKYYYNIDTLVNDKYVDVIIIAVRVRHHYDLLWKAIHNKKIIYCEWPLCLNSTEASTIYNLNNEFKLKHTVVGTQGRFSPSISFFRDLLSDNVIGEILFVRSHHLLPRFNVKENHWWSSKEEEHSGALGVATAHSIDTIQSVFGDINKLIAVSKTLHQDDHYIDSKNKFKWTAKDYVNIMFTINDINGSLCVSNLTNNDIGFELFVAGKKGHIKINMPYYVSYSPGNIYLTTNGKEKKLDIPKKYLTINSLNSDSPGYNISYSLLNLFNCVKTNKTSKPNFNDGYKLHKLIDKIKESDVKMKWVNL